MTERTDSPKRRPVLLVIGWDGATPDLLERFVAAGRLPTVKRLIDRGSFRRLRSTIPPVTACAWSSFLSGKNPGKHGLYDFVTPRQGTYQFDYTHGGYRRDRGTGLLAQLNGAGLKVGCVNVPMTYPPRAVDGFMVSGLDAPDEKSGIAHPAALFDEVQHETGGYRIDNRHLSHMRTDDDRRGALAEFMRIETLRTDVTLAMMRRRPVDVLLIVYNATDQVQHHFWHLMDAGHPQYPGAHAPEVRAFHNAIEEVYAHCDRELARLLEAFPEANTMLMSDHGAGPTSGPRVRLNNLLAEAGLLTWGKARGGLKADMVCKVDGWLRRTLSAKQKAALARLLPSGRTAIEALGLPPIDWNRTVAFAYEGFTLSPCVWINRTDLFPQGIVGPGAEYGRACTRVIEALTSVKDPRTGEPVIPRVYRAREVYRGDYVHKAPDLILDWWEGRTFTITKSHPKFAGEPAVFYPGPTALPGYDITGIHRRDGILVAAGPQLKALGVGPQPPAELIDIAPTTLALLGLPAGKDIDGRILDDLLAEGGAVVPPAPAVSRAGEPDDEPRLYSAQERTLIEQRLAGLGYLEER
ncbi:MAG: alkaline phosphatase family protein [Planctomycetota bacterium]